MDMRNPRFIVIDPANRPNGLVKIPAYGWCCSHSHILLYNRIDLDGGTEGLLPLVHRNQVHSHGRFPRLRRDVGWVHWCSPVQDFSFTCGLSSSSFRRDRGGQSDGRQIHPAYRAVSRSFLNDIRVHATGVKLGGIHGHFVVFAACFRLPSTSGNCQSS